MAIELRPLGVACNLRCHYCYQNGQRDAGNQLREYDVEKMKQAVASEQGPFSLFGGEALLLERNDLRALFEWGLERYGHNSIQTNGTLITDEVIDLFRTYRVQVGISVDGPDELNDARWMGTLSGTRKATAQTHNAIRRLCAEGLHPSLIVTLHRKNASDECLPRMCDWLRELEGMGIRSVRLHLLEVDSASTRATLALSIDENLRALRTFRELERGDLTSLHLDVFREMGRLLDGDDQGTTCVWNGCDPMTTRAVRGIDGNGQSTNCGRTNKDGVEFVKGDHEGFERSVLLFHTSQEHGGCAGCRFFLVCRGHCPGTAIDGDWRNRTEHCAVWYSLYTDLEREALDEGRVPISVAPDRDRLEQAMLVAWRAGSNPLLSLTRRTLAEAGA